jgi:hypothetical protein
MRRLWLISIVLPVVGITGARGPSTSRSALSPILPGSPVTLEAEPDDTGFLKCAANLLHPAFRHDNNADALLNPLKKASAIQTGVIAGHGHPGQVCTSGGRPCVLVPQSINMSNHQAWETWAAKWPTQFQSLTILACDTGEGTQGADLLKAIADATKMKVRAPTDFIWCKDNVMVLDDDAEWQEASPDHKPDPIYFKHREYAQMTPGTQIEVRVENEMRQISFGSTSVSSLSVLGARTGGFQAMSAVDAQTLIANINLQAPFVTLFVPDAEVTARFELRLEVDHRPLSKNFLVLNDRLVNDADDRTVYYRTSSSFTERLQAMRRR